MIFEFQIGNLQNLTKMFLLLVIMISSAHCRRMNDESDRDEEVPPTQRLVQVNIHFRHGDRAPAKLFPTYPYKVSNRVQSTGRKKEGEEKEKGKEEEKEKKKNRKKKE